MTIIGENSLENRSQSVLSLPIAARPGQVVSLSALAEIKYSSGPEAIYRYEKLRAITISITPTLIMLLEEAMQIIDIQIVGKFHEQGLLHGDTMVSLAGTADKLRQVWDGLRLNLLLALVITYLLLAAMFETWLYPFVILFSVPPGAKGGVLGGGYPEPERRPSGSGGTG